MAKGIKISEAARAASTPRSVQAALRFLVRAPSGQVFTLDLLAEKLRYSVLFLSRIAYLKPLAPYRLRMGHRYLYGSVKAIQNLRSQLENQRNTSA